MEILAKIDMSEFVINSSSSRKYRQRKTKQNKKRNFTLAQRSYVKRRLL